MELGENSQNLRGKSSYKYCFVPQCKNTSKSTPEKLFISVPKGDKRAKWVKQVRCPLDVSATSRLHCCEDHFDLQNDLKNYMRVKLDPNANILLKDDVLPTFFDCQSDRKRAWTSTERPGAKKLRHARTLAEIEEDLARSISLTSAGAVGETTVDESMTSSSTLYDVNNPSLNLEKELNTEFIIKEEIFEENVLLEHKLIKDEIIDEDVCKEHVRIKDEIVDESFPREHVQIKEEKVDEYIPIEPELDLENERISNISNRNTSIENLSADQKILTTETPFPRDTWNQIITYPIYLNKQEQIFPKRYTCGVCNKSFNKHAVFNQHFKRCRKRILKNISCDVCSKTFTRETNLSIHKRVHMDDRKPFVCEVCKQKFCYETCLIKHKRTHINDKFKKKERDLKEKLKTTEINGRTLRNSFTCGFCHKIFDRGINLVEHKRIHHNEIIFSCDVCSKTFNNVNSLNIHKRWHRKKNLTKRFSNMSNGNYITTNQNVRIKNRQTKQNLGNNTSNISNGKYIRTYQNVRLTKQNLTQNTSNVNVSNISDTSAVESAPMEMEQVQIKEKEILVNANVLMKHEPIHLNEQFSN